MIPTLPPRARNRLAETILAALHDHAARQTLGALADDTEAAGAWLGDAGPAHAEALRGRARRAREALASLPPLTREPSLEQALDAAAALFDAGLGFEVHELLEPHWVRESGERREVLQGLIQVAVGFQHRANGNPEGAAALLAEGAVRLAGRSLAELDLGAFVREVRRALDRPDAPAPPFPRRPGSRDGPSHQAVRRP